MSTVLCPKQPFFLNMTSHYRKAVIVKNGISHFYEFVAEDGMPDAIGIPDGCVDILFRCSKIAPDVILCGTGFAPRPLVLLKGERYFGVRFIPGYIPDFRTVSFADVVNRDVEFDELLSDKRMLEQILNATDFYGRIASFMNMYISENRYVASDDRYDLRKYIRARILNSNGTVPITAIAEDAGYSERYITKVFKQNYGMTPKVFSEIVKFQHLLGYMQEMDDEKVNLMYVAVDNDYYDESHMLRNFRKYMDETPSEYLRYVTSETYHNCLDIS